MSIRKIKGLESDFTIVPNKSINDKLSWAARGMLLYLCSKHDDWEVCISDLVKQTTGSKKKSGRDAVRAIMSELIECGYMRKSQDRNIKGQFKNADHEVSFVPFTENPYAAQATQESKDLTKERLKNTDISLVPKENGYSIEDIKHKYQLSFCQEALLTLELINDKNYTRRSYTGTLTIQEWGDCESAMRSVDEFDMEYFTWWMETRAKGFRKTPSLPNMLCNFDNNGADFETFYNSTFMQECD